MKLVAHIETVRFDDNFFSFFNFDREKKLLFSVQRRQFSLSWGRYMGYHIESLNHQPAFEGANQRLLSKCLAT